MLNEIEAKISYNVNDIKIAVMYIINNIKKVWKIFPIISIIIIGLVFYGMTMGFENYIYALILICVILGILLYVFLYNKPISSYINFYKNRKESSYIFSEKGIQLVNGDGHKNFDWSLFVDAYDIPSAFILSDEKMIYYIFPKRCFNNLTDIEEMKKLLLSKNKNYKVF